MHKSYKITDNKSLEVTLLQRMGSSSYNVGAHLSVYKNGLTFQMGLLLCLLIDVTWGKKQDHPGITLNISFPFLNLAEIEFRDMRHFEDFEEEDLVRKTPDSDLPLLIGKLKTYCGKIALEKRLS